jgi:nuclear GTP-binding protein
VLKKIAASKNKKNKEENKLPKKKSLKKKMIQVPNICPFKEEILQDVQAEKERLEKEKELLKLKRKATSLQEIATSASKRTEEFQIGKEDGQDDLEEETKSKSKENSLKAFYKEFKKVVDAADVVLEVVDARYRLSDIHYFVLIHFLSISNFQRSLGNTL